MTLYIRPVYNADSQLISLALCRTNGELVVDSEIVEHFSKNESGENIRLTAKEFHGNPNVEWGDCIDVV